MLKIPGDHCTGFSGQGLVLCSKLDMHVQDFCPGKPSIGRNMAALFEGKLYETE